MITETTHTAEGHADNKPLTKNYTVAVFDDEHHLLEAITNIRKEGVVIADVITPFPVHGIEDALGWNRSRIPTAGFIFGALGTTTALTLMTYVNVISWPINVGGKPSFGLPAFIPITFELTVLFAAIGMVLTFLISCRLAPGIKKPIFDERATDDRFLIILDTHSNSGKTGMEDLLKKNGAIEVNRKDI